MEELHGVDGGGVDEGEVGMVAVTVTVVVVLESSPAVVAVHLNHESVMTGRT